MKSPDRDAADATRLEAIIIAYDRLQATAAEAISKAECEAEEHKTDAEFWKHNAEVRASELATLRRRVAEMDRKTIERSLTLAADLLGGSMHAAARANIFGPLCDAYSGAASEMRLLAALAKSGDEIRDNNGLVWLAAETPDAPLPPGRNEPT